MGFLHYTGQKQEITLKIDFFFLNFKSKKPKASINIKKSIQILFIEQRSCISPVYRTNAGKSSKYAWKMWYFPLPPGTKAPPPPVPRLNIAPEIHDLHTSVVMWVRGVND